MFVIKIEGNAEERASRRHRDVLRRREPHAQGCFERSGPDRTGPKQELMAGRGCSGSAVVDTTEHKGGEE